MAADSAQKEPEEKKEGSPSPGKGGGKKGLFLIVGIVLLLAIGGGAVFFFSPHLLEGLPLVGKKGPSKESEKKAPEKQGYIYSLDPLIVNLADADSPRYLKIRIEIEGQDAKEKKEVTDRLPRFRDGVLTLLSSKTYKEIYDSEGKKKLKDVMAQQANQLWSGFQVKAIYFTEFVVQ